MTLLEMIQKAKRLVKSPELDESDLTSEVDSALTKESWAGWINDSQDYHMNLIIQSAQDYFGTLGTVSVSSGTQEYSLPSGLIQLRMVGRTDITPNKVLYPLDITKKLFYQTSYDIEDPYLRREYTYLWNHSLGIVPEPSGDETINIWYIRRLPKLSYGTADAVGATSITLASSPSLGETSNEDDYYNDARIYIVSASTNAGQTVTVSDYDGSTREATVTWSSGEPTGTVVYSIVCDIPEQFHSAVYTYASILAKISDDEDWSSLGVLHEKLVGNMIDALIPRTSQEARYVYYEKDLYYPF